MSAIAPKTTTVPTPELFRGLYERHRRGAYFRSAAVLLLSAAALVAYLVDAITRYQLLGIWGSSLFVILINPPALWVLSRTDTTRQVEVVSVLINLLEVLSYTAIIHFMGGLDAAYLLPMYCILIAYVGMVAPWRYSVIMAVASVAAFALVVLGEHLGVLDSHRPLVLPQASFKQFPLYAQMLVVLAVGLQLTVMALVSVFTARRLHQSRSLLRQQNLELESRVQERTAELVETNRRLSEENAERRRAEQALQQSETRYALATEAARVGVWDWDLTTGRVYLDPIIKTFFGYGPDEMESLLSEWSGRVVHPDDRPRLMELAMAIQQGRTDNYNIEYRGLDKEGGQHWVLNRGTVHRNADGRAVRIVGSTIDIDELKRIEEQLRASEQKFAAAFQSSPAIVSLSSLDEGRFFDVNENFLKVLGYTREEVIGRTSRELGIWAEPGDRDRTLSAMVNGEIRDFEVRCRTKDGEVRDLLWSAGQIDLTEGQALLTSAMDITDRKRARQERDRLIVELQEALEKVKTLRGLIPICAQCKKVRDDQGYWHQVESYVRDHSEAEFSHGLCPDCMAKLYPGHGKDRPNKDRAD